MTVRDAPPRRLEQPPRCSRRAASRELPLVHRLAMAYLLAPVAVWLLGWFHWWVGVPATALLAVGTWKALSGSWRLRRPSRTTVVLAVAAAVWVMTTPAGGVVKWGSEGDWLIYRAMLLDLTRGAWPTHPVDYLHDAAPLLRYGLGWWIAPVLPARWLGPWALNWAVPLWTWCGTALVVLLFARRLPTLRAALLAVAVLVFFSGMDIVEEVLREGVPNVRQLAMTTTASSPMYLEYQSLTKILQTKPHHFMPACLATLLMLQLRERRRFLEAVGVVLAACLFWSPLLSTGLLVLALAMLANNPNARRMASWRNVFVAVPLAALIALYLTSGQIDFERGWLWELYDDRIQLAADVLLLYAAEFVVLAALLWRLDPRTVRDPLFVAAVAMLLIAPWYYYSSHNWSTRFSYPAVVVLAYWAARSVVAPPMPHRARTARRALLAVLATGVVTVVPQVEDMLSNLGLVRFQYLRHSSVIDTRFVRRDEKQVLWLLERTSYAVHPVLAELLRDHEPNQAEKGTLLLRSAYDVYLLQGRLVYVNKDRCSLGNGLARTRFYAYVYPADPRVLPPNRADMGYERIAFRLNRWRYREGGGCVVPVPLPDYEIARIETGQTTTDGQVIWEADAHLTPNPPMDGPEPER